MGVAYRYWRLLMLSAASATDGQVHSLKLYASVDWSGANLAVTGAGTASGGPSSHSFWPADAFDSNDSSTYWQGNVDAGPAWLQWDFGAGIAYDIQSCAIVAKVYAPGTLYIQGSADGATWESRMMCAAPKANATTLLSAAANPPAFSAMVLGSPQRILGASRPASQPRISVPPPTLDLEDGGQYRIAGTVKVKGTPNVPVHRRVVLINERSRRIVRETWSDAATGAYVFDGIRGGVTYTTLAYDYTGNYRGVLADNLTAERML